MIRTTGAPLARARRLLAVAICLPLLGCYSVGYAVRAGSLESRVPVDANNPHSDVRWSNFWGLSQDLWEPVGCTEPDGRQHIVNQAEKDPSCTSYYPLCDHGVGRLEVKLLPYSVPLMLSRSGWQSRCG